MNVGVVLYTKGKEAGTLDAKWCHAQEGSGTGVATGGPTDGYEGRYHIRYCDEDGNIVAERGLDIKKDGNSYKLQWLHDGKVTAKGIGMETDEGLSAGYRNV